MGRCFDVRQFQDIGSAAVEYALIVGRDITGLGVVGVRGKSSSQLLRSVTDGARQEHLVKWWTPATGRPNGVQSGGFPRADG